MLLMGRIGRAPTNAWSRIQHTNGASGHQTPTRDSSAFGCSILTVTTIIPSTSFPKRGQTSVLPRNGTAAHQSRKLLGNPLPERLRAERPAKVARAPGG